MFRRCSLHPVRLEDISGEGSRVGTPGACVLPFDRGQPRLPPTGDRTASSCGCLRVPRPLRSISGTHNRVRIHNRGQPPAAHLRRAESELAALVLSVFSGDPLRRLREPPECPRRSKLIFTYGK